MEINADCVIANFSPNNDNTITITNSKQILPSNKIIKVISTARLLKSSESIGELVVKLKGVSKREANFKILSTDYTSYAIVWSCMSYLFFGSAEFLWIFSRTPELARSIVDNEITTKFDRKRIRITNHDPIKCHYEL